MKTTHELIEELNSSDETSKIEAKRATSISRSIMETICAFSNEPNLGGGHILLGVERAEKKYSASYKLVGLSQPDKLQLDLASQCASIFNFPIRPEITIEEIKGKIIAKIFIQELAMAQKPLFFKKDGLPQGAFRRVGSSDQRCSEEDLIHFYANTTAFDSSVVLDSTLEDLDEHAIRHYRQLRKNVNPHADELSCNDTELLEALGCIQKTKRGWMLTYAGLLVFGSNAAHRRLIPMMRVDYIRVPGNEWVEDPENRFNTIDMRGALILLVSRSYNAIVDDLPKGFLLPEGQLQAESVGIPSRVLREALVNAFMHRSYRVHQPIQIIRYNNRIEIRNSGFSLKPEDRLGEPGSQARNPHIATIFHETNLAETKGSGIRTMRKMMKQVGMAPPTFESDHVSNTFTILLLLHHFLSEEDLIWLQQFEGCKLNDRQKKALIFVREAAAIDNSTYRQLNGCEMYKASQELRQLREKSLLEQKGKGRTTYYVSEGELKRLSAPVQGLSAPVQGLSAPVQGLSAPVQGLSAPVQGLEIITVEQAFPDALQQLRHIGKRCQEETKIKYFILKLCAWKKHNLQQIAQLLERQPKYILRKFIQPLLSEKRLEYTIPDMPNHPEQAYKIKDHIT